MVFVYLIGERIKIAMKLYSFDIFDTLVTRRVASPNGIFAIMQSILINKTNFSDFIKNNFYRIRIESEKLARKCIKRRFDINEISFDTIYSYIQNNYNLTSEQVDFLKNLEIATEINNMVPIEENISKLKELIKGGQRVVLISDMYLSEENIRKILVHVDSVFSDVKIYVSSEYKLRKSDGQLYIEVAKAENVEFCDWLHTGDNKNADIVQAKLLGIKTEYFKNKPLKPYEKFMLQDSNDNVFFQLTAGSARLARFIKPALNKDKYDFGASFAAPVLYNYVDYIIAQALERNLKTLYFVARDGYILKLIADRIISKKRLGLKTKYIYGSRLAWKLPTEDNFDVYLDRIFEEYKKFFEIPLVAVPLGVSPENLCEMLGCKNINQKLSIEQQEKALEKFKTTPNLRQRLIDINKPKKEMLIAYLKQEIDFTEENIAFVDLDGSGKTQDIISEVLNEIKPCNVYFFYITNPLMEQKNRSIKLCYGIYRPHFYWVELLGRTTSGQTIGYKYEDNKVVPIMEKGIEKVMSKWGYNEYLEGLLAYTEFAIDAEIVNNMSFSHIDIYCKYFDYINKKLDRKTADILGSVPCTHVGSETQLKYSSAPYKLRRLLMEYLTSWKNLYPQPYLPFVSVARSSDRCKSFLKFKKKYPSLLDYIFTFTVDKFSGKAYADILGIRISCTHLYRRFSK